MGIDGQVLKWIENYLSNRSQKVFVGQIMSDAHTVNECVPQGSILGPIFFLDYINDIVDN
jgi:hypothetical protein